MSSDFRTVLQKDAVLADITPELVYAVKSGASSLTYQSFPATSASNSSVTMNVQVPSENIITDRRALIQTPLQFTLRFSNINAGQTACIWGQTASLGVYPFASSLTTATCSINNATVSINTQDVLSSLLHLNDNETLFRANGYSPSLPDQTFGSYADSIGSNSSPLASYFNMGYQNDIKPRGAFPCYSQVDRYIGAAYQDHSPISTGVANENWVVSVFTVVTEPIFMSPWIFGNPEGNQAGLLGVNNMNFVFTVNSALSRMASVVVPTGGVVTISAGVLADPDGGKWAANSNLFNLAYRPSQIAAPASGGPTLLLSLLSSQPSDKLQTKNVVPFTDYPRYITSSANNQIVAARGTSSITTSNLQLSSMPDVFIVTARRPAGLMSVTDSSSFLTIRGVSINLNNSSGLLSSSSQHQLWKLSQKNGSVQTWEEFSGSAFCNNLALGQNGLVPTIGSVFLVSPTDLSLPDYISSGNLMSANLQMTLQVYNQFNENISPEVCIICVNSGVMTLMQGTTAIYTGLLTRSQTLETKQMRPSTMAFQRMTGGGRNMFSHGIACHPSYLEKSGGASSGGAMSAGMGVRSKLEGMY